jgi:hypothetical protein
MPSMCSDSGCVSSKLPIPCSGRADSSNRASAAATRWAGKYLRQRIWRTRRRTHIRALWATVGAAERTADTGLRSDGCSPGTHRVLTGCSGSAHGCSRSTCSEVVTGICALSAKRLSSPTASPCTTPCPTYLCCTAADASTAALGAAGCRCQARISAVALLPWAACCRCMRLHAGVLHAVACFRC